ncbi:hypothetical protein GIB67_028175 [Kingdonia uniflora]|uniref:Uncharacterized protein n=1 Tax=Kingdonia uniflora TaxID=39325 RepID=A0A7J7KZR5_9MAGN|nr:hypothetical protein GIB67_028175 [Kingdonia uniflora]
MVQDEREVLPSNAEAAGASAGHGIEVAVEFKPVEHPVEPFDNDQPVKCPLPEPSILNDGRIWKERMSATSESSDLPTVREASSVTPEGNGIRSARPRSSHSTRSISHH